MNIGFYLPLINQQVEAHRNIITNINLLCEHRPYDNIVVFNNYFQLIDANKKYYILSTNHAKYFRGILFLFDTQSAFLTQTFPGPDKQIIYINEAEWAQQHNAPFTLWHNIYMNSKFDTISSNPEIDKLMKICWKAPIATIANFDHKEVDNVIQRL